MPESFWGMINSVSVRKERTGTEATCKGKDLLPDFILERGNSRIARILPTITPRIHRSESFLARIGPPLSVRGGNVCARGGRRKVDTQVGEGLGCGEGDDRELSSGVFLEEVSARRLGEDGLGETYVAFEDVECADVGLTKAGDVGSPDARFFLLEISVALQGQHVSRTSCQPYSPLE